MRGINMDNVVQTQNPNSKNQSNLLQFDPSNNTRIYKSVSTLGPERTNSHDAAQAFLHSVGGTGEPVLSRTPEDSFEEMLSGRVDAVVVCNLYPSIHKLYLPNLHRCYAAEVLIFPAEMGLFARSKDQNIVTVAAPPTSTAFLHQDNFEWVEAPSNSEAARMCFRGEVDGAVGTDASAAEVNLVKVRDFGEFPVPYTVFRRKSKEGKKE